MPTWVVSCLAAVALPFLIGSWRRHRSAAEKGLTELVGSIVPSALAARGDYADYAAGETILAISVPDDSAAGKSCGERCASLNHVMERLAAGLKEHAPQLVDEKRLLLTIMDGEHSTENMHS